MPDKNARHATEDDLAPRMLVAERLEAQHILDIAENRLLAVNVPQYCNPQIAELATKRITNDFVDKLGTYEKANIDYLGEPFYNTNDDPRTREAYYQAMVQKARDFRRLFDPNLSPSDKLRLELDEIWGPGAQILNLGGRKLSPAVVRVFRTEGAALPHQDDLAWDAPYDTEAQSFKCQLTALTYLKTSDEGGEVLLWDKRLSAVEYDRLREADTYGLRIDELPPPDLIIKPRQGDLLIFNASKIHAVGKTLAGMRASISSFIGFSGRYLPLKFWQ